MIVEVVMSERNEGNYPCQTMLHTLKFQDVPLELGNNTLFVDVTRVSPAR